MKIETILSAMVSALVKGKANYFLEQDEYLAEKYYRQYRAFRDRILRLGNDHEEAYYNGVSAGLDVRQETIRQKNTEIARLNVEVDYLRRNND